MWVFTVPQIAPCELVSSYQRHAEKQMRCIIDDYAEDGGPGEV